MAFETWVADMAREELEMLEAQHPNRFGYLKLEIKYLISHPNNTSSNHDDADRVDHALSAPTQVSCNRKRKPIEEDDHQKEQHKKEFLHKSKSKRGRVDGIMNGGCERRCEKDSRVEMALRRAEACLRRIQLFKQSFLS